MNIAQIFDQAAIQWPERIAIIDKDSKQYTYYELRQLVMQQADQYLKKGISAGDRVMVFVPMCTELYVSVLALFHIGAVAVFLDEWVNKERMELCCKLAGCKGFVASFKIRVYGLLSKELRKISHWYPLPKTTLKSVIKNYPLYQSKPDDTALITFTTGSTGIPKAANRTHAFLKAQFEALMPLTQPLPGYPTGPDMPMLPIVLLLNLGRGVTSVIADFKPTKPLAFQPEKVWMQIQKHAVVSLTTSPYYAGMLAGSAPSGHIGLKRMMIGGAAVFPNLVKKIREKIRNIETVIVYGSTEAEPVSHISGSELLAFHQQHTPSEGLFVGYPDCATGVSILPLDYLPGQPFQPILTKMQPGEICVSGSHVLQSYLDNPEADKQTKIWAGNICWHRTGDAGYTDDTGRLFLLGRCKQVINYQGKTYYPFLIEYFMQNLPGISIGTVLLKDKKLLAVLQAENNINTAEIEKEIQQLLPDAVIIYKKAIPLDPRHHAKVEYEKLLSDL